MSLVVVTAPSAEPVTLAEAKAHLRVDDLFSDAVITAMIVAARQLAESGTRRALMAQTWDFYRDEFPSWGLIVPLPPLQSISSITYTDTNGASQTLATDQYLVDPYREPGRITPAYGLAWPGTRQQANAVKVRFVAGYTSATLVPQGIKSWMLLTIGNMSEHRTELEDGNYQALPFADSLLTQNRVALA